MKSTKIFILFWMYSIGNNTIANDLFVINDNVKIIDSKNKIIYVKELTKLKYEDGFCDGNNYINITYKGKKGFIKSSDTSCIPNHWHRVRFLQFEYYIPNKENVKIRKAFNDIYDAKYKNYMIFISIKNDKLKINKDNTKYIDKNGLIDKIFDRRKDFIYTYNYKYGLGEDVHIYSKKIVIKNTDKIFEILVTYSLKPRYYSVKTKNSYKWIEEKLTFKSEQEEKEFVQTLKKIAFSFDVYEPQKLPLHSRYRVSIPALRVRSAASTESKHLFTLKQGEDVTILENVKTEILYDKNAYWVKIKTKDGRQGYAFSAFLEPAANLGR